MSVGEIILVLVLSVIPIAGLIVLLIWAFDADGPECMKNLAKALLICKAVGIGLALLLIIASVSIISSLIGIIGGGLRMIF